MADKKVRIAVRILGYNLNTDTIDTFRYSNAGFTKIIGADIIPAYYEPYLGDSILIKQDVADDAISVRLNNNGTLDSLLNYTFKDYEIKVYMSIHNSPNNEKFYPLFSGKINTLDVKFNTVEIKAKSNFTSLDEDINHEVFTGVSTDFEGETELAGKNKPRLIGSAFNITPYLLKSNTLIYGFNWSKSGTRDSSIEISSIRDGGSPLTLELAGGSAGDFATTALMDAFSPPPGKYVTCIAESTVKLGSSPVYGVTLDADNGTNTYTGWIQLIATEANLAGYVIQSAPNYKIGVWLEGLTTYIQANEQLSENLDLYMWFDSEAKLNVSTLGKDNPLNPVNFIESGLELTNDNDIPYFDIERVSYELPIKKAIVKFNKNYTTQSQSDLAGLVTEGDKEPYKEEYLSTSLENIISPDPYPLDNTEEHDTSIQLEADAITELARWLSLRDSIVDYINITVPILDYNSYAIIGVIASGSTLYLNVSVTDTLVSSSTVLVSDSNTTYSEQDSLILGGLVTITGTRFNYSETNFFITKIEINTRTMMATYTLRGER